MADQDHITNTPEIPEGFCQCGCGQKVPINKSHPKSRFHRYVCGHNARGKVGTWKGITGPAHPGWNGGKYVNTGGYVMIYSPNHPYKDARGYVREHILVIEKAFGRYLQPEETVHHIDGDKTNNALGNLMVFATKSMHMKFHARLRAFKACGHWDWKKCRFCHKFDHPSKLSNYKNLNYHHPSCAAAYEKERRIRKQQQALTLLPE